MIRPAAMEDLPELLALYAGARAFMAANGNPDQWGTSSPPRYVLEEDIRKKRLFICERNRSVCGAFALVFGDDPTYARIEGGAWRSDAPYGTIHRIAGKETERGIFEECLSWCREQTGHIRIDTHEKNAVMRHLIEKNGFVRCGHHPCGGRKPEDRLRMDGRRRSDRRSLPRKKGQPVINRPSFFSRLFHPAGANIRLLFLFIFFPGIGADPAHQGDHQADDDDNDKDAHHALGHDGAISE